MEKVIKHSDQLLIEQCLAGNRQAQFRLYARHARSMLNSAYRIVRNQEDAKDVLQDAFLKAFQNMHNYREQSVFEAWLRRIVINTAINFVKKKKLLISSDLEKVLPYQADEGEAELPDGLSIELAQSALMQLPQGYRTVLSLYLLEGYDHKEIASILDISISTSLTQYSRGKRKLATIIKNMQSHG